jgi:hypothetical protein
MLTDTRQRDAEVQQGGRFYAPAGLGQYCQALP